MLQLWPTAAGNLNAFFYQPLQSLTRPIFCTSASERVISQSGAVGALESRAGVRKIAFASYT